MDGQPARGRVCIVSTVILLILALYLLQPIFLEQLERAFLEKAFGPRSMRPPGGEAVILDITGIILGAALMGLCLPRSGKALLGLDLALLCGAAFLWLEFHLFSAGIAHASPIYPLLSIGAAYAGVSLHTTLLHERSAAALRAAASDMGDRISAIRDIDELLPRILECMLSAAGAARGMLMMAGADGTADGGLRAAYGRNMPAAGPSALGAEVIGRVRTTKRSIFVRHERRALSQAGKDSLPRSVLCLPLLGRSSMLGVIYLEDGAVPGVFRDEDAGILDSLAARAAGAIENASIHGALRRMEEKLRAENVYLKREVRESKHPASVVGKSAALRACLGLVEKASGSDIAVLIEGETGTGKELVARAIHFSGRRKDAVFVAQNCGALPEALLESELFGYRKGAFTGAVADKKGLLEIADGGAIFLDEVADMAPRLQVKLLRVLEEGAMRAVGDVREKKIDLRIISATNKDLSREVSAGAFREDLYYRLNAFTIRVPPLRERKEDIPLLAAHFLERAQRRLGKRLGGIRKDAMLALVAYDYPGNVRELENEIEKAAVMAAEGGCIGLEDLSEKISRIPPAAGPRRAPSRPQRLDEAQRECILKAIITCGGNRTRAAELLGISRRGLAYMLKRLHIEV